MTVFLDTSAILAVLNGDDQCHPEADAIWRRLLGTEEPLLSSNYVLVELFALAQRRLGMAAVRAVELEIVPLLDLHWLDAEMHHASVTAWLAASRRSVSLVDFSSFEVMRHAGFGGLHPVGEWIREGQADPFPEVRHALGEAVLPNGDVDTPSA